MLAKKVRALCKKRGVAVSTMEKATGLSNGTLNKWEKGTSPSADKVKRVAEYFGTTVDELLSEKKPV